MFSHVMTLICNKSYKPSPTSYCICNSKNLNLFLWPTYKMTSVNRVMLQATVIRVALREVSPLGSHFGNTLRLLFSTWALCLNMSNRLYSLTKTAFNQAQKRDYTNVIVSLIQQARLPFFQPPYWMLCFLLFIFLHIVFLLSLVHFLITKCKFNFLSLSNSSKVN